MSEVDSIENELQTKTFSCTLVQKFASHQPRALTEKLVLVREYWFWNAEKILVGEGTKGFLKQFFFFKLVYLLRINDTKKKWIDGVTVPLPNQVKIILWLFFINSQLIILQNKYGVTTYPLFGASCNSCQGKFKGQ